MGAGVSVDPQRAAALRALTRVRRDGAWIQAAIEGDSAASKLGARERAFVHALARGTVEHLGTLDVLIDSAADRPSSIEPRVRDALRVAAYDTVYLSTPDRAAVNEGVELVRSVQPRAVGLANAVLHRIAERAADDPFGDVDTDLDAFALSTGHPSWLAALLADEFGEDTARSAMLADESPAPLYLAVNPFATSLPDLIAELEDAGCGPHASDVPGSVLCDDPSRAVTSEALREGRAIVCDLAPQAIVAATPLDPGQTLFESAAGRGTKTVLLQAAAARAGGEARIVAADIHEFKTRLLDKRVSDLAVPGVSSVVLDARDASAVMAAVGGAPDVVFVDAPCTGLGTLRRHPEKRWATVPEQIEELACLAEELMSSAMQVVRPGGFVVYSTCTLTRRENAQVVDSALQSQADSFEVVSLADRIAPSMLRWVTPEGYFQSLPEPGGPDGHFAAVVRRLQ